MSFGITDFPYLNAQSVTPNSGTATLVPADASAPAVVTFNTPYSNGVTFIGITITGPTWDGYQLAAQAIAVTLTGFEILVSGGPPGSTVSVYWYSQGT